MSDGLADDDPAVGAAIELRRRALFDALGECFKDYDQINPLSDHPSTLDAVLSVHVGGRVLPADTLLTNLYHECHKRGLLPSLLRRAVECQPAHAGLRRLAKEVGLRDVRRSVVAMEQALRRHQFDLTRLETECRRVLRGRRDRGLCEITLHGAEPEVFAALGQRVRPLLGIGAESPHVQELVLDARVSQLQPQCRRLEQALGKAGGQPVLVLVDARHAPATMVSELLTAARQRLSGPQPFNALVLVSVSQPPALAPPPPALAVPELEPADLYDWVESVCDGQGWSEALRQAFKDRLLARSCFEGQVQAGLAYDAIDEAIRLLRENLDEPTLRQRLAESTEP